MRRMRRIVSGSQSIHQKLQGACVNYSPRQVRLGRPRSSLLALIAIMAPAAEPQGSAATPLAKKPTSNDDDGRSGGACDPFFACGRSSVCAFEPLRSTGREPLGSHTQPASLDQVSQAPFAGKGNHFAWSCAFSIVGQENGDALWMKSIQLTPFPPSCRRQ